MPQRTKDLNWPLEETLSVTASEKVVVVEGINENGLLGVLYETLSHDEGKLAGATIQDLHFKIVPHEQSDVAGPQAYQSPYAVVFRSPSGAPVLRGNAIPLGFILKPGEKMSIFYKSAATAGPTSVVLRLQRTKLFDRAKWESLAP